MGYLNKFCSLQEMASAQIAISFCQRNSFKEVALCLEKPIYGLYYYMYETSTSHFISDSMMLSLWNKVKEAGMKREDQSGRNLERSFYQVFNEARQWDAAVHNQCQRLTECLPHSLRHRVSFWISRIALEYLSFSRRQEFLFGVSRYFLMDALTREDWTQACRLDEEKLAKRFIQDERLTVLQRFRMACVYCLYANMSALWMRLTLEEKQSLVGKCNSHLQEKNSLVLIGSHYIDDHQNENVIEPPTYLLAFAAQEAIWYGNRAILEPYWKKLKESVKLELVSDLALQSLHHWQITRSSRWKKKLFLDDLLQSQTESIQHFQLPSYYSELVRFFLSEMCEIKQLNFFQRAFQNESYDSVLECFLDWPHHIDFLPIVRRLWGVIPKKKYEQCLLAIARKNSIDCKRNHFSKLFSIESHYCDYRSLLCKLWEETPLEYRQYLFSSQVPRNTGCLTIPKNDGHHLFNMLLYRSPFLEKDEALFRKIWRDLLPEEKTMLMHSNVGKAICSMCIMKEKWCFLNNLIKESFPVEEIPVFKKKFIFSKFGHWLCLYKLNTREKFEDLIGSALEMHYEKLIFQCDKIDKKEYLDTFKLTLNENKLTDKYFIKRSHSLSYKKTGQFNLNFLKYACRALLKDCAWEQMNNLFAWSFDKEEEISDFKKYLFSCKGADVHYKLVFIQRRWEDVDCFYRWFSLSPEEVINMKKETIMCPTVTKDVYKALYRYTDELVASLRWCLTDVEMVINFKEKVEEHLKKTVDKEGEKAKERLDCLVSELLSDFKMKVSRKDATIENKGEKRSLVVKDESSSTRKLFKLSI